MRLSNATLGSARAGVRTPAYDRARVTPGIVHLGIGAFHRAHQAVVLDTVLEHDPSSVRWRRPSRFFVELTGAPAITPTYGGQITSTCAAGCTLSRSLALGVYGMFHGGYELGSGFSFGVAGGYVRSSTRIQQRGVKIDIVSDDNDPKGSITDTLTLSSGLFGAWAGLAFGDRGDFREIRKRQ